MKSGAASTMLLNSLHNLISAHRINLIAQRRLLAIARQVSENYADVLPGERDVLLCPVLDMCEQVVVTDPR